MLKNCHELHQVYIPKRYKLSLLCPEDFELLKCVYGLIYQNANDFVFTRTVKVIKSIRVYGQQLGSLRDRRNKSSSFVSAQWANQDGCISSDSSIPKRPGQVMHYILNSVKIDTGYILPGTSICCGDLV